MLKHGGDKVLPVVPQLIMPLTGTWPSHVVEALESIFDTKSRAKKFMHLCVDILFELHMFFISALVLFLLVALFISLIPVCRALL